MSIFTKSIIVLFLLNLTFTFGQIKIKEKKEAKSTSTNTTEIKLIPNDQLKAIKENYNWNNEKFLIINFKNLQVKCNYEIYEDVVKAYNLYEKKAFDKMDLSQCKNIFVYADKPLAKPILDNKMHFEDIGLYFMKNYFNQENNCVGVIVINQKGEYLVETEEYNTFTIVEMMKKL